MFIDKDYRFNLDIKNKSFVPKMEFIRDDINTGVLNITLTEDGVPIDISDTKIEAVFRKPDKTTVLDKVDIIDARAGEIKVLLSTQTISKVGEVLGYISIFQENAKLTSKMFKFKVSENFDTDELVKSSNDLSFLQVLVDAGRNEVKRIAEEDKRLKNESGRQTKETERCNLENKRKSDEKIRNNKEIERLENEKIRISSENQRIKAETSRIEAEKSRVIEWNSIKETYAEKNIGDMKKNIYDKNNDGIVDKAHLANIAEKAHLSDISTIANSIEWNNVKNKPVQLKVLTEPLNLYVDTATGNDNNIGTSENNKFKTINRAIKEINEYHIINADVNIYIVPGVYNENIEMNGNIGSGDILFRNSAYDSIVLDSNERINITQYKYYVNINRLYIKNNTSRIYMLGFIFCAKNENEFMNSKNRSGSSGALVYLYNSNANLYRCGFKGSSVLEKLNYSYGLFAVNNSNALVRSCEIGSIKAKSLASGIRCDSLCNILSLFNGYYENQVDLLADAGEIRSYMDHSSKGNLIQHINSCGIVEVKKQV